MEDVKITIEKYPDGYVAYALGIEGIVVRGNDTYEETEADIRSAIRFHPETLMKI